MLATGEDADGEPACTGHATKGTVTVTATMEMCACGRERGHKGRHRGSEFQPRQQLPELPEQTEAKQIAVRRHRKPLVLDTTPAEKVIVRLPESVMRVALAHGEMVITVSGDLLTIMQNKEDHHFITALLNTIRCRGKMMHPFTDKTKDKITGKMIPIQMDEGFVDDMLSMAEPDEKARMLAVAWEKGK